MGQPSARAARADPDRGRQPGRGADRDHRLAEPGRRDRRRRGRAERRDHRQPVLQRRGQRRGEFRLCRRPQPAAGAQRGRRDRGRHRYLAGHRVPGRPVRRPRPGRRRPHRLWQLLRVPPARAGCARLQDARGRAHRWPRRRLPQPRLRRRRPARERHAVRTLRRRWRHARHHQQLHLHQRAAALPALRAYPQGQPAHARDARRHHDPPRHHLRHPRRRASQARRPQHAGARRQGGRPRRCRRAASACCSNPTRPTSPTNSR